MTRLGKVLTILATIGFVTFIGTFIVRQSFGARAQLIQLVEIDKANEALFGDAEPTKIGSPQEMIIGDQNAFLKGQGADGVKLVDNSYLRKHEIYPLQMKTVDFTLGLVRWSAFAGGFLMLSLNWLVNRRKISRTHETSDPFLNV